MKRASLSTRARDEIARGDEILSKNPTFCGQKRGFND
jgi:hypothetical protein